MRNADLIKVTDPAILAHFPAIAPPKDELTDIVSISRGRSESTYTTNPGRPKAGVGEVFQCETCGTYLRAGQPHSALQPEPHQTLGALILLVDRVED